MIYLFRGEHDWLSNFYPVEIEYDGRMYSSLENAYQSAKNDDDFWKNYCQMSSAKDVKKKSHTIKVKDNWRIIRNKIMFKLLQQKYSKEPFRTKLKETG